MGAEQTYPMEKETTAKDLWKYMKLSENCTIYSEGTHVIGIECKCGVQTPVLADAYALQASMTPPTFKLVVFMCRECDDIILEHI